MSYHDEEDDDSDTGIEEDIEALRRACTFTDSVNNLPKPSIDDDDDEAENDFAVGGDDDDESENEDIELLRQVEQRYSSCTTDIGSEQPPSISMKPLNIILPSDDDYGDDFETLRAIQRRFSQYNDSMYSNMESSPLQVGATNIELEKESSTNFFNNGQGFPDIVDGDQKLDISSNKSSEGGHELVSVTDSSFPRSAQSFVEAIKKNRNCQKFIRNKIVQIEARLEENKKLRERVKILKDFQVACRKRTGRALSQKKDARIQLISVPKMRSNAKVKDKDQNTPALYQGPAENSQVANYRDAMSKYPFSLNREPWSKEEKDNLFKGYKQQVQETLVQHLYSAGDVDTCYLDSMMGKIRDHEISPQEMRKFLPKVNWSFLASMYVTGRSGPECQSRWMNCEDPLINRDPWRVEEDKKLLYIAQRQQISNWIEIAGKLGTNRTPFQCLSRFQRSLNVSIIKNEWTASEDEELRLAVSEYGESNWQVVASTLEGRTGTQCSNRWKKSLNPMRERVGKWGADEDKRLKIAVKLFGAKNWYKIARFVPGRTQVQCRERWVNCLDPLLNTKEWTQEEDSKLLEAISEHGYSWSRIAACVPPRTDSQCRRRWKVLLPHEVPMLEAARKMKKAALISNFVDREEERPALSANDFLAPPLLIQSATEAILTTQNKRNIPKRRNRRARKDTDTENVLKLRDEDDNVEEMENLLDLSNGEEARSYNTEMKKNSKQKKASGNALQIRSRRDRKVTHTDKALKLRDEDDVLEDTEDLLDLSNGEKTRPSDVEIEKKATWKQKKRKQGGKKHDEKMDAILNQSILTSCSRRANDEDLDMMTTERNIINPCLLQVAANKVSSSRGDGPQTITYKRRLKRKSDFGEEIIILEDEETLASFYKKVKKRKLEKDGV